MNKENRNKAESNTKFQFNYWQFNQNWTIKGVSIIEKIFNLKRR